MIDLQRLSLEEIQPPKAQTCSVPWRYVLQLGTGFPLLEWGAGVDCTSCWVDWEEPCCCDMTRVLDSRRRPRAPYAVYNAAVQYQALWVSEGLYAKAVQANQVAIGGVSERSGRCVRVYICRRDEPKCVQDSWVDNITGGVTTAPYASEFVDTKKGGVDNNGTAKAVPLCASTGTVIDGACVVWVFRDLLFTGS